MAPDLDTINKILYNCNSLDDLVEAFDGDFAPGESSPFNDLFIAKTYDSLMDGTRASMLKGTIDDFCNSIKTPISDGTRFLEVGCGSGRVTLALADRLKESNCSFIGVDPSGAMINLANDNLKQASTNHTIEFIEARPYDKRITNDFGEMDYLIIRNSLFWMSDVEQELKFWIKCLKSGGMILIRELRQDAYLPLLKQRIKNCFEFETEGEILSYPPSAMVAAYKLALTSEKLVDILNNCDISITTIRPVEGDDLKSEPWGVEMYIYGEK